MKLNTILSHTAKLFSLMMKSPQPTNVLASHYFRSHKYIGSNDRKMISESVYATLRMKQLAEICTSLFPIANPLHHDILIIAAVMTIIHNVDYYSSIFEPAKILNKMNFDDSDDLNELISRSLLQADVLTPEQARTFARVVLEKLSFLDTKIQVTINESEEIVFEQQKLIESRFSMPLWLMNEWKTSKHHNRTWKNCCQLADSMLFPAPLSLRVNQNISDTDSVIKAFKSNGIECTQGKISPNAVIIRQRVDITQHQLFKNGIVEVQDEGSQVISAVLAPEKNLTVLDACAGAGGKSLHIAALQNDSGKIMAADIELKKLKELNKRAVRSGFNSIETVLAKNLLQNKSLLDSFDYVLIDAPCSGSGTFRRSPILKWKITEEMVKKLARKQLEMMRDYSRYVKPGGILVYSTCSLLPQENDMVIEQFLEQTDEFEISPIKPGLEKLGFNITDINNDEHSLSLTPYEHGCDGFFMARLTKTN
jgi:16S rRNA (cytosine967-C5)-methyltransferase